MRLWEAFGVACFAIVEEGLDPVSGAWWQDEYAPTGLGEHPASYNAFCAKRTDPAIARVYLAYERDPELLLEVAARAEPGQRED